MTEAADDGLIAVSSHRKRVGNGKAEARMAILAGIDEAGFGPLLGPLVVSSAAFSVEPGLLGADLWQVLVKSVGQCRKHLAGRLLIADSKKAFNRDEGLGHLERTSLVVLDCLGKRPAELTELLTLLCPDCLPRLAEYPWHQDLQECRLAAASSDHRIAAKVFSEDLLAHGAALAHLRTCCLDVAYFNRMVNRVRNKAQVLFIAVTQLIQGLLDAFPRETLHIQIDRQGGRSHYRENLLRSFPGMELAVLQEGDECSVYEMRNGARAVRLTFEVKADDRYLPVSLASMVSKYIRELLMDRMNLYFAKLDAGLKPTAGYWQDGQRFVQELRSRLPHLAIDNERLIRCR
jgi:ribonuclease HII